MIPLRDTVKSTHTPYVNIALIIINVVIFIWEKTLTPWELQQFYVTWGAIPENSLYHLSQGDVISGCLPILTAAFIHGSWLHIISNMLFLWVFGDNVEDRLGHGKYLVFYLLMAFLANSAQIMMTPYATYPLIGASGAVAGILGAYYRLYPKAKVLTLIPIFFVITFMEIKSSVFIIIWFLLQILNGYMSIRNSGSMVGWWAHIGGFLFGLFLISLFIKGRGKRIELMKNNGNKY